MPSLFSRVSLLLAIFLSVHFSLSSQQDIKGVIHDNSGIALAYANVILQAAADSSFITGTIANDDGVFALKQVEPGNYLVQLSMIGFETQLVPVEVYSNAGQFIDLGIIQLSTGEVLDEIEAVAEKQFIEQNIDRMTLNVANSPSFAGGTALDVLENAPGVIVDRQNSNLSLAGKDGVQVMINGRIKYVPAAALLQMLQGMSADNIEKIEIITTPPSNLDAEGNAGYINLVLKTNEEDGFNGNLAANIGVRRWEIGGFNVNMNYRQGRSNIYGDYSLDYSHYPNLFEFERANIVDGELKNLATVTDREIYQINQNARLGYDYQLSKQTIIGVLLSGYKNIYNLESESATEFGTDNRVDTFVNMTTDYDSSNLDESIFGGYISFDWEASEKTSYKFGLRYEHTFSVLGSEEKRRLIDREYGNLFPSFYVSHELSDKASINGAFSRRIRRQTFNDMAPFVLFMDPFSFWSGNSALQPSISDNFSLGIKYSTVLLMLSYTFEDEAIQRYQGRIDPETNRMTLVTQNMDYQRTFNATLALPVTVTDWWEMQNNFQFIYSDGRIIYEGTAYNVKQSSYQINTTQRFKFSKRWSGEVVASYRSAQLRGQFISLPYYGVNAGIQFKLPNDNGILRLNASDIFDTWVFSTRNNLEEEGLVMDGDWDFSVPSVRLTFSRTFGDSGVKKARKRSEVEEKSRVE